MSEQPTKDQLLTAAQRLLEEGRYERAIHEYQRILTMDPKDQRVRLRLAELYIKQKQVGLAAKAFQEVATAYVAEGFYLKAVTVYKNLLRVDPSRHDVNLALAELYEKMGLNQDAIHQYQIVLRRHEQKGQAADALELRRRIVALDPEQLTNRVRLAEAYQLRGDEAASMREYESIAERLHEKGTEAQQVELYEKILSRRPDHLELLRRLCRIYAKQREWRKVLHWLTHGAKLVAQDAELLRLLAEVHAKLNQIESARSKWRELAELHVGQGDPDAALVAYEEVLLLAPEEATELTEAVDRVVPGGMVQLLARVEERRQQQLQEETAPEVAPAPAVNQHIQQVEARARAGASRRSVAPVEPPPTEEDLAGLRQRAEASLQLGQAYLQMAMADEARVEFQKALASYRRIASLEGSATLQETIARLERLLSPTTESQ
ncbi:MAG: tetratricopeptide repeat protein [Deltaproteobacteria bacterium]|nr:tetratricopeptide repeat protein [Deltaproteobacteria bacterium]